MVIISDSLPNSVFSIPFLSEVITISYVEQVSVDLNVLSNYQVLRLEYNPLPRLVVSSLQKLSSPETWVFQRRFIDLQTVIVQEVSDNKLSVRVFRLRRSKDCVKSKRDLLINPLEEIFFGRLWYQSKNVSQRIFLWTDSVVRRNDNI